VKPAFRRCQQPGPGGANPKPPLEVEVSDFMTPLRRLLPVGFGAAASASQVWGGEGRACNYHYRHRRRSLHHEKLVFRATLNIKYCFRTIAHDEMSIIAKGITKWLPISKFKDM